MNKLRVTFFTNYKLKLGTRLFSQFFTLAQNWFALNQITHISNIFKNVRNWRSVCRKNNTPKGIYSGFNSVNMFSMYVWLVDTVESLLQLFLGIWAVRYGHFLKLLPIYRNGNTIKVSWTLDKTLELKPIWALRQIEKSYQCTWSFDQREAREKNMKPRYITKWACQIICFR